MFPQSWSKLWRQWQLQKTNKIGDTDKSFSKTKWILGVVSKEDCKSSCDWVSYVKLQIWYYRIPLYLGNLYLGKQCFSNQYLGNCYFWQSVFWQLYFWQSVFWQLDNRQSVFWQSMWIGNYCLNSYVCKQIGFYPSVPLLL